MMEKEYVLKEDFVIKAGTRLINAPDKIEFATNHYEIIVGFGLDNFGSFILDQEIIKKYPDLFLELQ